MAIEVVIAFDGRAAGTDPSSVESLSGGEVMGEVSERRVGVGRGGG